MAKIYEAMVTIKVIANDEDEAERTIENILDHHRDCDDYNIMMLEEIESDN